MIQRHSIILWKKEEKRDKSFEEIAKETYEVLTIFQNYPRELRPNYLTVKTKRDTKEFDWNYENFSNLLKKGINKDGETIFEDLGYCISFFSSLKEQDSCGFGITAGNKKEKFYNTLNINLPLSLNLYNKKMAREISNLFEKLVQVYTPYWGCISNKALSRKYGKYLDGNLPTTVHWLNYWSEDIIQAVGLEKVRKIVDENSTISFRNAILQVKDTAFDISKEEDVKFHDFLQTQLFCKAPQQHIKNLY